MGGSFSFTSGTTEYSLPATAKFKNLEIAPSIGKFVINKLALGLKGTYQDDRNSIDANNNSSKYFSIGPFCRYYYLNKERQANLFSEIGYQFASTLSSNSVNQSIFSFNNGGSYLF